MSQRRGTGGGIKGSSLPKEHLRGDDGRPICRARPRHNGWLFVKERPTCLACACVQLKQVLRTSNDALPAETPAAVVKRLGIDVPKWAADIRRRVAAACDAKVKP